MIQASDIYAMLYLLNREIRKSWKSMSLSNVFSPICWDVAKEQMEAASMWAGTQKTHELLASACSRAATALECGQTSLMTLKVYFIGEYIRRNHGQFFKRKKDGSLSMRKSKSETSKKKVLYNAVDIKSLGRLEGIERYKPDTLKEEISTLRDKSQRVVSVLELRDDQTNILYDMLAAGDISLHVYLHLYKINNGFGIDLDRKSVSDEYRKFIKMCRWLIDDGFDLKDVWFHGRA